MTFDKSKKCICVSIIILSVILISSCGSDSSINTTTTNSYYNKIFTAESGTTKFEIWSATASSLLKGYNDIGFKVFLNGNKQTAGFVKYFPKMYHTFNGVPVHSTPVSSSYPYNSDKDLFVGYANFYMATDSASKWYSWFNYNDANTIDSILTGISLNSMSQIRIFTDNTTGTNVYMTLIGPMIPKQGLNDFSIMVHRTSDEINFWEADSIEMYIRTWMPLMGHSSSDNVNPVNIGHGWYQGKFNLNMSGQWYVYDSLKYNNQFITPTPPPSFIFDAP